MNNVQNETDHNLIDLVVEKEVSALFKRFLEILEDLKNSKKIYQADFDFYRKKVLDSGNDCERNILQFTNYFDFVINKEKVENAAKQRITKRVCINSVISL